MDVEGNAVQAIVAANRNEEKLPWALMLCGVMITAAALGLVVYRPPAGIFLVNNGSKLVFYSYHGILLAVLLFGLVEAWVGYGASCDLERWRAVGKKIMWFSILPLVLVLGIGGGVAFAAPK